jgi:hypothetical protein
MGAKHNQGGESPMSGQITGIQAQDGGGGGSGLPPWLSQILGGLGGVAPRAAQTGMQLMNPLGMLSGGGAPTGGKLK